MGRDTAYWYRRGRVVPVGEGRLAFVTAMPPNAAFPKIEFQTPRSPKKEKAPRRGPFLNYDYRQWFGDEVLSSRLAPAPWGSEASDLLEASD
jgi:hypothetical protein